MGFCVIVLQFQVDPVSCGDTKGILLCGGPGNLICLCSVCMPYLATLPHCSAMNRRSILSVSTLPSVSDRIKKTGCISLTLLYQRPVSTAHAVQHSGLFCSLECTVLRCEMLIFQLSVVWHMHASYHGIKQSDWVALCNQAGFRYMAWHVIACCQHCMKGQSLWSKTGFVFRSSYKTA